MRRGDNFHPVELARQPKQGNEGVLQHQLMLLFVEGGTMHHDLVRGTLPLRCFGASHGEATLTPITPTTQRRNPSLP